MLEALLTGLFLGVLFGAQREELPGRNERRGILARAQLWRGNDGSPRYRHQGSAPLLDLDGRLVERNHLADHGNVGYQGSLDRGPEAGRETHADEDAESDRAKYL